MIGYCGKFGISHEAYSLCSWRLELQKTKMEKVGKWQDEVALDMRRENQREKLLLHAMNISTFVNDNRMRRSIGGEILRDIAGLTKIALKVLHALIGSLQTVEKLENRQLPDNEVCFTLEKLEEIDDLLYGIKLQTT